MRDINVFEFTWREWELAKKADAQKVDGKKNPGKSVTGMGVLGEEGLGNSGRAMGTESRAHNLETITSKRIAGNVRKKKGNRIY